MTRANAPLDLLANLALVGAAAAIVIRPRHARRIAETSLIPRSRDLVRTTAERLAQRRAPRRSASKGEELVRLASYYTPAARRRRSELTRMTGRRLNGGAGMLALSVLADSAVEHYRGSFQNRAMYTPLVISALALGASLFGRIDGRPEKHWLRDTIYAASAATGFVGFGFHAYNILKRPGGWSWLNLFYSAPIGAPMALALAGLLGRAAERVRQAPSLTKATLLGLPAGRCIAAVIAAGLAGTVGEAGLLHFRGAYHNPVMLAPVTMPPVAAALLGASALQPRHTTHGLTRWWLRLTALLGLAGVGFHAYGVSRNMGGWRNWSQNVLNGPPLPAPPSFTGLALAGLAALALIEQEETDA